MHKTYELSAASSKLKASGIAIDDAAHLGFSVVKASDLCKEFHGITALVLPYFGVDGNDTGFYRIRYLDKLPGFGGQVAKPQRYAQPAGTLNWAYLPRLPDVNWAAIAADATTPLVITEGELKAACACLYGYNTIGLGGVSVWSSSKRSVPLLPPLDQFNWKGRQVTVIFDSDAATNPQVAQASVRLCKELLRLGAAPSVASLPAASNGEKQGLDDFLVAGKDLDSVLADTRTLELGNYLLEFNQRYAFVSKMDVVVSLNDGHMWRRDSFVNGTCANVKVIEFVQTGRGLKREERLVAKEWLGWTARRDVSGITYAPGKPRITESGEFNGWKEWGVEPRPGSVGLWHELLRFAFSEEPDQLSWFEKWAAYPLQHPGTKLHTAVVLWSPGQGVGKSLIGNTLGKIYGSNFTALNSALLHGSFNGWYQNRQFILGDEIVGSDKRGEADKLKSIITQETAWINSKGIPEFEIPDYVNWLMTSNHSNAFFMDKQDRRFVIIRLPIDPMQKEFYDKFVKWRDEEGGAESLFHHLLGIDLSDFNPTAPAPLTQSKLEMIEHGMSDLACFMHHFSHNLDLELTRIAEFLHLKEVPELVTSKMLLMYYDKDEKTRVTTNGVARELTKFGFRRLPLVRTAAFGSVRFNIVKNTDFWMKAKPDEIRDYADRIFVSQQPKKGKM